MVGGIELKEAHYPGRAPIDAYGNGGFRFADMSHIGSIICLPWGVFAWEASSYDDVTLEQLSVALHNQGALDVMLFGLGADFRLVPDAIKTAFVEAGIIVEPMSTGSAVRTYNVLLAEERAVGCALLAVS